MCSAAGESDETIDSGMKVPHLLYGSSMRFGFLYKAVHLDYELRRRQNGLL